MNEEYSTYLNSEAWQLKRTQRMALSHFRCAACKSKSVNVHHLTYERIFNEDMQDLLPLCRKHHEEIEILKSKGLVPTAGSPLFLLAETVRLLCQQKTPQLQQKQKSESPEIEVVASNSTQSEIIGSDWFADAIRLKRKAFLKLCRQKFEGPSKGKLCSNAIALYDRKRKVENGVAGSISRKVKAKIAKINKSLKKSVVIYRPYDGNWTKQSERWVYDPK